MCFKYCVLHISAIEHGLIKVGSSLNKDTQLSSSRISTERTFTDLLIIIHLLIMFSISSSYPKGVSHLGFLKQEAVPVIQSLTVFDWLRLR